MKVNGELFVLVNFLFNGLSLWLAARLNGGPQPTKGRYASAALSGALYGTAAYLPGLSILKGFPFLLVCGFLMAKILFPKLRPLLLIKAGLLVLLCGLLLGGLGSFLLAQGLAVWLVSAVIFLSMTGAGIFLFARLQARSKVTMVEIAVDSSAFFSQTIRLPAMLDTGNQLTDPITGLPVVVASSSSLKPILPKALSPEDPETLPFGFRLLRVQTTAGRRLMMCFRPSQFRVQLEGTWHDSQALIAIAPTGYDGAQALVPSAVVDAL